jgi:hypothetical protein
MKNSKTLGLLAVAVLVVGLYIFSNTQPATITVDENKSQPPAEIPQDNGPEGALSSCVDKSVTDKCSFIINAQEQDGVCQDIMGTLTCGPSYSEQEGNQPSI